MQTSCQQYNVPVIKEWSGGDIAASNASELMERIRDLKNVEGAVIRFNDGRMFKLKTEWYFSQSKSHLALPNQEREVWAMVSSLTFKLNTEFQVEKTNSSWIANFIIPKLNLPPRSSEFQVEIQVEQVLDSKVDDLLPQLSAEVTKKLQDFQMKLFTAVDEISEKYQNIVFKLKPEVSNKKDFVARFKDQYSVLEFSLMSKIYDGLDPRWN